MKEKQFVVGLSEGHVRQELMSEMTHKSQNLIIKRTYTCMVQNTVTKVISFNSQNNAEAGEGGGGVSVCVVLLQSFLYRGDNSGSERSDMSNTGYP